MKYLLTADDYKTVFDFAIKYHLNPSKSGFSRTSGTSRGLGGVLDSFVRGKLVEIGVAKILKSINNNKDFILDFEIKSNNQIIEEPDIVTIIENNTERKPKVFVEIKTIGSSDRWVGLTKEQLDTSKNYGGENNVYIIGATINNIQVDKTEKEKDFVGSYLKEITGTDLFNSFADLKNSQVSIEYIFSALDLEKFGRSYPKGGFLYETEVFKVAGVNDIRNLLAKKYKFISTLTSGDKIAPYKISEYKAPDFGDFILSGDVEIYEKVNKSSVVKFVKCNSKVIFDNPILGKFSLDKDKIYSFKTGTVGRNPILGRNNVWVAKRNVYQLIKDSKILNTDIYLKLIAENI